MARKGQKRSGSTKGRSTAAKKSATPPARKPAAPAAAKTAKPSGAVVTPASRPPRRAASAGATRGVGSAAAPSAPPVEPTLLERAERLRDDVLRSKLCHPNPWSYTAKARGWTERARRVVEDAAAGRSADAGRRALDALAAEVEGDRDYQEARRLL